MNIQTLAEFSRRRQRNENAAVAARVAAARAALPELVQLLVVRYQVSEVILFGSLAWGEPHAASDIDLAVAGLRPEDTWRALADCNEASPVPVQIVPLDAGAPSLVQRVRAQGLVLHGA